MNCIILPPTPQEVAEYERQQREAMEKFERDIQELTKEMFSPLEDAFKDAFSTIELFGMRLRIVEGADCSKCVFCANKDSGTCMMHFGSDVPCVRSDKTADRHFEQIKEDEL